MKKIPIPGVTLFVCLVLILFLTGAPAYAQGQNLLTNPGFEPPFVAAGGEPPREVAQGWTPWHLTGGASASENVQPEYCAASDVVCGLGIPRIRGGSDAQQYHSFFATHDGGVFQRVASGVSSGAQLRFGVFVYVWSTSFDDVDSSEQDGGVVVRVGIDPTGGTDPASQNIVWSSPTVQYDTYAEYFVTTAARGNAVTVFVRTTVSFPVKNNNIYLDDASLTVSGAQAPTATNTRAATATPTKAATSTPGDLGVIPTNTTVPVATATLTTQAPATNTPISAATFTPTPAASTNTAAAPPTSTATHLSPPPPTNTRPPTVTPTQSPVPPPTATSGAPITSQFPNSIVHIVQPGDTVGRLASLYGSTVQAIVEANGLNQFAFIRVDQRLVIPVRLAAPATSTPTNTPAVIIVVTATPGVAQVPAGTTGNVYVVQSGDTMFRIATRYNTTVAALAQLNGIVNPNVIRVGQRLVVPVPGGSNPPPTALPPSPTSAGPTPVLVTPTPGSVPAPTTVPTAVTSTTYTVQPGDNLYRIAIRFGVPLSRLIQVNGIVDPNRIFVGQRLTIP